MSKKTPEEISATSELLPKHFAKLATELIEVHGKEKAGAILRNAATMVEYPGSEGMVGGLYMAALFQIGGK